jgi:hypothetical protein
LSCSLLVLLSPCPALPLSLFSVSFSYPVITRLLVWWSYSLLVVDFRIFLVACFC